MMMVLFVMIEIPKEVLEEDCNEATKKHLPSLIWFCAITE